MFRFTQLFARAVRPAVVACARSTQSLSVASYRPYSQLNKAINFSTPTIAEKPLSRVAVPFYLNPTYQLRPYSTGDVITVKVPSMGDSISEGTIEKWAKSVGDFVKEDELICVIETDKVANEMRAPRAGVLAEQLAAQGSTVHVGAELYRLRPGTAAEASAAAPAAAAAAPAAAAPAKKAEAAPAAAAAPAKKPEAPKAAPAAPAAPAGQATPAGDRERRVPMTRLRKRIAERLKDSQNTSAMLTTFQECDMHNLMTLRNDFKDLFLEKHGVKLGFMSAFVKSSAVALQQLPVVNAVIDGDDILYRDFVDISVAVATPKGLVTPVLRDCDKMSFSDIEKEIAGLGDKARKGQITLEDLAGGTFTISNGGVYGSLMGTPIINPPQSAILGMHGIVKRPVVVDDQIVIRPIMYLALTYDHRLIDGREAVTFLRKIKAGVEDPRALLLDVL